MTSENLSAASISRLVRVLAPALRRHGGRGALKDLEQRLLNAFAGDIAGDRRILALAGDLVDLVDVDDPGLGLLDVVVGRLDQLEQDVLDVLADIARLGQRGGVRDGERHIEHPGQSLGQQGLAGAGGAEEEDVGLGQLDGVLMAPAGVLAGLDALVVVVHRDRERLLRRLLADDIALEELIDLARLGKVLPAYFGGLGELLLDDLVAEIDALVADVHTGPCDELLHLLLALSAERALEQVAAITDACHEVLPLRLGPASSTDPGACAGASPGDDPPGPL
jgi:hypothetical protein